MLILGQYILTAPNFSTNKIDSLEYKYLILLTLILTAALTIQNLRHNIQTLFRMKKYPLLYERLLQKNYTLTSLIPKVHLNLSHKSYSSKSQVKMTVKCFSMTILMTI